MKKIFAVAVAAVLSLSVLAGCGGNDDADGANKDDKNNTAPVITGVKDEDTIFAGEEWDALEGVTATDAEDGDITDKIEVSAEGLTFSNGKTTPTEPNYLGYQVIYTVKDSGGKEAAAQYCSLVVNDAVAALENVFTADFSKAPDVAQGQENAAMHYWKLNKSEAGDATATLKQGALVVDVANGGENAYNVLLKRGFDGFEAVKYRVVAWVDSSAATTIKAKASVDSTGYSEEKDVTLTAGYQKVEIEFSITDAGKAWFEFHLGGAGKEGYSLSFIKIDIYKVIGTGADDVLASHDFTTSSNGITDGGSTVISFNNDTKETHIGVTYATEKDDWRAKAVISLGNVTVTRNTQYKYSFKLKATGKLTVNVCVEQSEDADAYKHRASWNQFTVEAGKEKEITQLIKAGEGQNDWTTEDTIENAVIRLYLGIHEDGQSSNDVVIKDFKFVIPGQTERKAHDNFLLFGRDSINKKDTKYPYQCESGSDDEDNPVAGVATAYVEGGKLVYKVYEGGAKPENNKLIIGFNGEEWDETQSKNVPYKNSFELPANAYYVISFKVKASVALDFNFTVHDIANQGATGDRAWDRGLLLRRAGFNTPADPVHIGATEQTLEFTTNAAYVASQLELIFEFGSDALAAAGVVTIEISDLTIGYRSISD